ncbi:MAG TPA: lysylphosphatidylglycerol synthase transmembrane domain-containing protein [Thermoanaerobaculia bacterium]|nr:lysylphosphatidylglycerol synthase transmembrane domain-containing protein [Thermoanaerobaculia bacterium]
MSVAPEPGRRPMGRRRRSPVAWAKTIGGLLIALAGLAVAFRRVDLEALRAALVQASWPWFAGAGALTVFAVAVRAWRWRLLLAPIDRVGLEPLFSATMIGYFGNGVLPLRLGELMRAVALGRRGTRVDTGAALGSIAVERLLDVASAVLLAALVVPLAGDSRVASGSRWGAVALVAAGFGGLVGASRSARVRAWLGTLAGRGGRFGALARSFLRGLLTLGDMRLLPPIALQTAVIWLAYGVVTWMAARAAGISLTWLETGLVVVATTVAVSLPSAPGYVGTFHAAAVLVVGDLLGYAATPAQAFALLAHAASWLPTVAIGGLCLLQSSMRIDEVRGLARAEAITSRDAADGNACGGAERSGSG